MDQRSIYILRGGSLGKFMQILSQIYFIFKGTASHKNVARDKYIYSVYRLVFLGFFSSCFFNIIKPLVLRQL